jgi:hypothetical protein
MVGPVSRACAGWVSIFWGVTFSARVALAAEADVTVQCAELSAEDAAQVEARVRANLLSAGLEPANVELECTADTAQTQVTGNGHQVLLRSSRDAAPVKEALLASAESALSAWSAQGVHAADTSLPHQPPPVAPPPPPAPPPVAPRTLPPAPRELSPTALSRPDKTWLSAGLRGERWHRSSGLGPQLGLERALAAAWLSIHAGYLLSVPTSARFSAHELQLGVQLGWQPDGVLGLRGALDSGLSAFGASPATGVSATNDRTSSTLPFVGLELSRPTDFGSVALVPVAGLRAFASARAVRVDGQEAMALPNLALQASLNLALKIGG